MTYTPRTVAGHFTDHGRRYIVFVEPRIEPAQLRATGRTIDHEPIPEDAIEFAVSGLTYHAERDGSRDRRYTDCVAAGQITDDLARIPSDRARHMLELWQRWHLNGMRPNCRHMPDQRYTPGLPCPAGLPLDPNPQDSVSRIPATYTSGSAWLYEPIPPDALDDIRRTFGIRV